MTKDDVIDRLVSEHSLVRREAKDIVDTFFDDIKDRVSRGERVVLAGAGALYLVERGHRKRRDIEVTEETPPWRIPHFQPHPLIQARAERAAYKAEHRKDGS